MTFDSRERAIQGLVEYYETLLRKQHGTSSRQPIKYHVQDVVKFLNSLEDLALLEKAEDSLNFLPHDRDWLIRQVSAFFAAL